MRSLKFLFFLVFILRLSTAQSQNNAPLYLAGELNGQEVKIFDFLRETSSKPYTEKSNALSKQVEALEEAVKHGEPKQDTLKKLQQAHYLLIQQAIKLYEDLNRRAEAYALIKPEQESSLFLGALDTFLNGHVQEAIYILETAHHQRLADVHAVLLLADMYTLQFENAKAAVCFESAIRIDTTDCNSLYECANFFRIAGDFEKAQVFCEKILQSRKAADWQIARTYYLSGQIYHDIEAFKLALRAYKHYADYLEQAIRLNPQDIFYKKNLAILYYKLGYMYKEHAFDSIDSYPDFMALRDTALIYFKKRTQIWNEIYRNDPEYEIKNNSLSISYETLINEYYSTSYNLDSTIQYELKYVTLLEKLCSTYPNLVDFEYRLSVQYTGLASCYAEAGRLDTAIEYYKLSLTNSFKLCKNLEKIDTAKTYYVRHFGDQEEVIYYKINGKYIKYLWVSVYESLGKLYFDKNRLDSAVVYYAKGIDLYKERVARDTSFKGYSANFAINYSRLGAVYQAQGNIDSALSCALKEAWIYEQILKTSTKGQDFNKLAVAFSYERVGDMYQLKGRLDSALNYFLVSAGLINEASRHYPQSENYGSRLADSYAKTGAVYALLNQKNKAILYDEKALELYKELFDAFTLEKYRDRREALEREVARLKSN